MFHAANSQSKFRANLLANFRSHTRNSARRTAVSLWVEQFGEARVFLQKREIFIVARVIAIFRAELDGNFQILHRRFRFAGKAIESGHGVNDVVRFRSGFARAVQMLAGFIPTAQVHQRNSLRVVLFCGFECRNGRARNALLTDAYVHLGAIAELLAGAFQDAFEGLLGALELLLLEVLKGFFVEFQLCLLGGGIRVWRQRNGFSFPAGLYRLLFQ